jgi:hypothetical protein
MNTDCLHSDTQQAISISVFRVNFKDYKVERADEISKPGMIDSQVISHLIEADLVIADLTSRNANAFYELGIRHLIQKPVIHVYRRGEPIPADIQPYRAIEFEYTEKDDIREAKSALRKAVLETQSDDFHIENPVTRSRAMIKIKEREAKQRDELMELANGSQYPISHLQGMLENVASKTVEMRMAPGSWKSYLDEVLRSQSVAKKLYWAINQLFM